jgi:Rrf2 family protein
VKVSTRGDYAARALLSLALRGSDRPTSVKEIAERTSLPQPYLEQILLSVKGAGLVRSKRGVGGGYVLAHAPERITLATSSRGRRRSRYGRQCKHRRNRLALEASDFEPQQHGRRGRDVGLPHGADPDAAAHAAAPGHEARRHGGASGQVAPARTHGCRCEQIPGDVFREREALEGFETEPGLGICASLARGLEHDLDCVRVTLVDRGCDRVA